MTKHTIPHCQASPLYLPSSVFSISPVPLLSLFLFLGLTEARREKRVRECTLGEMPSFCYLFHSLASHVHSIPFLFLLLYLPLLSFLLFAAVIFLPCPFRAFPNLLIGTERREDCPRQRPEEAKVGREWRGCEETNGQNSRHRERRDGGNGMTWRRGKRGEGKI